MSVVLFLLFFFVGLFVISFTAIPVLIIFNFGIPTTKDLEKAGYLIKGNNIITGYFVSASLLTIVFMIVTIFAAWISPDAFWGYIIGGAMILVPGIRKIGTNSENMSDYLETNSNKLTDSGKEFFNLA